MKWGEVFRLFVVALVAAACDVRGKIEDEIRDRIPVPGDSGGDSDPEVEQDEISINSVQPRRGLVTGGTTVDIIGVNFVEGAQVFFGSTAAIGVQVVSEHLIKCVTPARPEPGLVGVRVSHAATAKSDTLDSAFAYYEPVTVGSITPGRGTSDGGVVVTISGTGFVDGTMVEFGDSESLEPTIIDSENLWVTAPALPRDSYAVTVSNLNGEVTVFDAYRTFDPVRVFAVAPTFGPLSGGTTVVASGSGFISPTTLELGALELAGASSVDETALSVTTTDISASAVEGTVDVIATNDNGTWTLRDGFVFFDGSDSTPRLVAVTPSAALIGGGNTIHLVGVGLAVEPTVVTIGGAVADCDVITDNALSCVAPPGTQGLTELHVSNAVLDATVPFEYVNLAAALAVPARGAVSGGTYVTLSGDGFGSDTLVYFDGRVARDVTVVSPNELTLRTPSGALGPADVTIATRGIEVTVLGLYDYFEPADYEEWTGGGPIEGSVNVTVMDADTGELLAGAFVVLGSTVEETAPHRYGYTDARGQITLSGPEVFGPQSVHAFKDGYGAFSWLATDAQNLTMTLNPDPAPPPDPLPPCPDPSGGGGPALVRGRIIRLKDQYNPGNDTVVVTTTYVSFSAPLPDPGPRAQIVNQGEYEAFVRPGELVLIAQAGIIGPDDQLDVRSLGFRPFVYTEPSTIAECADTSACDLGEQCLKAQPDAPTGVCIRVYDGMDITVDTPLSQQMQIELVDPPLNIVGSYPNWSRPTRAYAFVWYDFGSMGLWPMGSVSDDVDTLFLPMPRQLPESIASFPFHVDAEVGGAGAMGDYTWVRRFRPNNFNTREPVYVEPMLRALRELTPVLGNSPGIPMRFELEQLPVNGAPDPTGQLHYIYDVVGVPICEHPVFGVFSRSVALFHWMALGPGLLSEFELPYLPPPNDGLNAPADYYGWQVLGLYAPNADYDHLDVNELFGAMSETGRATAVTMP